METTRELPTVFLRMLVLGAAIAAMAAAALSAAAAGDEAGTISAPGSASTSVNIGSTWYDL
jgi:hypothetical protein